MSSFPSSNTHQIFALSGPGEEEDLAVYNWGDGLTGNLLEGGDDLNDETFGGSEPIGDYWHTKSRHQGGMVSKIS